MKLHTMTKILVVTTIAILFGGCASVRTSVKAITEKERPTLYSPVHYMKDDALSAKIKTAFDNPEAIKTESARNQLVFEAILVVNKNYSEYIDFMTQARAGFLTLAESAALGTTTAATIVSGSSAKTLLSGVSAFILGTKSNVEKNFYQEVSFFILSTRMKAERQKAYSKILENSNLKIDEYGIAQAISDIDFYYNAGTVMNAFAVDYEGAKSDAEKAQLADEIWPVLQQRIKIEVPEERK